MKCILFGCDCDSFKERKINIKRIKLQNHNCHVKKKKKKI